MAGRKKKKPNPNYMIFRLRGAYSLFEEIGSQKGMNAVDEALVKRGAEKESTRRKKEMTR